MHTVSLLGELDNRSAWALEAELERLCEVGVARVTLDLSGLAYIDATGVAVIAFRCGWCERRGQEVRLIAGSGAIQRAFELANVSARLPFVGEQLELVQDGARGADAASRVAAQLDEESRGSCWAVRRRLSLAPAGAERRLARGKPWSPRPA